MWWPAPQLLETRETAGPEELRFRDPKPWHGLHLGGVAAAPRWQLPPCVVVEVKSEPDMKPQLDIECDAKTIAWFSRLDNHVLKTAKESSSRWLDRTESAEKLEHMHHKIVRAGGVLRLRMAWDGRWEDTHLWRQGGEKEPPPQLAPGMVVTPIVMAQRLWFSTSQFGLTLQATDLLVSEKMND